MAHALTLSGDWILIDGQEAFALLEQDADRLKGQTLDQVVAQAATVVLVLILRLLLSAPAGATGRT